MKREIDYAWLAGLLDGDGCFCIGINRRQQNGHWSITFNPRVIIGLKGADAWLLEAIQSETGQGRCYISNNGKAHEHAVWQTTNLADSIIIAKAVSPHLRLKKGTARQFLEACNLLIERKNIHVNHCAGERAYDLETVLRVAEIATTLNEGRQTKRYRTYKGMNYWEPILKEIYS